MGRFDRYVTQGNGGLAPLRKLRPGESFVAELLGFHEIESRFTDKDKPPKPSPVLELRDEDGEFGWIASGWSAEEELALADPEDGDTIRVARRPDRGRSHQYEVTVVREARAEAEVAIDSADLPSAADLRDAELDERFGKEMP